MIDDVARRFIEAQRVFFVASAPLDAGGHENLSPKGLDTFRILGPTTVAYVDFNGSEVETVAHLKENGRIVLMFCAFQPPNIFRLYGHGRVVEPHEAEFAALAESFPTCESAHRSLLSNSPASRTLADMAFLFPSMKASGSSSTPGRATVGRRD
jgi:hypothetical protein